ncbi:MAG TPA: hypothetical protein PK388_00940 [Kiritimatiellia bacterium]|nr:hypothetical protein [Kiritimatiellia bacterium]
MRKLHVTRRGSWFSLVGCAALLALAAAGAGAAEPEEAPPMLKHAVVCPPFKGDKAIAAIYHSEMVKALQDAPGVEYFEGARRLPEFSFRINGSIVTNEDGEYFVLVTLADEARKEQIASHVAPASLDRAIVAGWSRTIREDVERRAAKLPFECRVTRQQGQESVSLDRGLGSGLEPGMVLYVSEDEEPLMSPTTGDVIGRDSPRAAGQIQVFRVMDDSAYARPVLDAKLPRFSKLFARSF